LKKFGKILKNSKKTLALVDRAAIMIIDIIVLFLLYILVSVNEAVNRLYFCYSLQHLTLSHKGWSFKVPAFFMRYEN